MTTPIRLNALRSHSIFNFIVSTPSDDVSIFCLFVLNSWKYGKLCLCASTVGALNLQTSISIAITKHNESFFSSKDLLAFSYALNKISMRMVSRAHVLRAQVTEQKEQEEEENHFEPNWTRALWRIKEKTKRNKTATKRINQKQKQQQKKHEM